MYKQKWIVETEVKNNVPDITNLLRYWPMLEIFGGEALVIDYVISRQIFLMFIVKIVKK